MSERVYERLERVKWQRRSYHPVGDTPDEIAACMTWVRSLGHEARSQEPDGFRYRNVYPEASEFTDRTTSAWYWTEPGEWLMCMSGDGQVSELDAPHDAPEHDYLLGMDDWHEVAPAPVSRQTETTEG